MPEELKVNNRYDSMRGWFGFELYNNMVHNPNIVVVTADLGYGLFDGIKKDFSDRFYNCGAAEQAACGISVGLAMEGKIPFYYSITPFLLYRCFETIRNYINHEGIPVKLIGSGRDRDYQHDGFSHWAEEDRRILKEFKNIRSYWLEKKEELPQLIAEMIKTPEPYYINLKR